MAFLLHYKDDCIIFYQIYCVLFSYISFTFPQNTKCFFSNGTNNMHILASGPELQAFRFGYVFRWKLRKWGGLSLTSFKAGKHIRFTSFLPACYMCNQREKNTRPPLLHTLRWMQSLPSPSIWQF